MNVNAKSMIKATVIITLFSIVSKVLGLIRESTLAAIYGAGFETDAYKVAFELPLILFGLIGGAITTTFIPVYSGYKKNKTEEQIQYFLNNIFNIVVALSLFFTISGTIFAPFLVKIMVHGFAPEAVSLTLKLTVILLPALVFNAINVLIYVFLQANNHFTMPAFAAIPFNMVIIGSILYFNKSGIEAVAIGSLIAYALQFLVQFPAAIKSGYRFKPVIDVREDGIRTIALLAVPILLNSLFSQAYTIVNRALASGFSSGSISVLDYATKVNSLLYSTFIGPILTVVYPNLSYLTDNMAKFKTLVSKTASIVIYMTLPIIAGIMLLGYQLVNILFERGAFTSSDTGITAATLSCFAFSILGMGITVLLDSSFYCLKDTRTPMITSMFTIILNTVFSIILSKLWGISGLAVSASLTSLISCIILFFLFKRRAGSFKGTEIAVSILKASAGAIFMALCIYFFNKLFMSNLAANSGVAKVLKLFANICVGAVIYISLMFALKVKEIGYLMSLVKTRIHL